MRRPNDAEPRLEIAANRTVERAGEIWSGSSPLPAMIESIRCCAADADVSSEGQQRGLRVFDANGFIQKAIAPTGEVPTLRPGANRIAFQCETCGPARITVIAHGKPLH